MEASLRFYHEIIGMPLNRKTKVNPFMELAFLGSGETQLELICNTKAESIDMGKDISLGFDVKSLDGMLEVLKKNNVAVHSGPFQPNPSIKFLFVLDPDGARIQFVENIK
jgi:lactoylglutathione lyase